jgi:hypothetical protein
MADGILDTLGLAATAVVVLPVAMLGVNKLAGGETALGLAMLGVVVLILAIEKYVVAPSDLLGMVAKRATGKVVEVDDED